MSDDDRHPAIGSDGKLKRDPPRPTLERLALRLFGGQPGMTPTHILTVMGRMAIAIVLLAAAVLLVALI